jgi:lipooligosaccharide transport system ATP-binding protein
LQTRRRHLNWSVALSSNVHSIIEARHLRKAFGDIEAVKDISFDVQPGLCVGLLGPNGAGKTTTMRMIMGLTTVSHGTLRVFGVPIDDLTRADMARIGLVSQEDSLDPDLSVRYNLELYGRYYGLAIREVRKRVPDLLAFMQLSERAESRVNQLSGGMKRRLVIARALVASPDLVILDEPTTGLDPQARVLIWKRLLDLKKVGKTLLLTTHYMDEAERLCDHIIIVDQGEILDQGSPRELIDRHVRGHVFEVHKPLPDVLNGDSFDAEDIGDSVLFYVDDAPGFTNAVPETTVYLHRHANLEDVFLRLTGRALREG